VLTVGVSEFSSGHSGAVVSYLAGDNWVLSETDGILTDVVYCECKRACENSKCLCAAQIRLIRSVASESSSQAKFTDPSPLTLLACWLSYKKGLQPLKTLFRFPKGALLDIRLNLERLLTRRRL